MLFAFFKKLAAANHPENKLNKNAKVYVWSGGPHDVGHVSMQFHGKDGSPIYTSIWPNKFPSIGPLTIFPLHAGLATKLSDDIKSESRRLPLELDNGFESMLLNENRGDEVRPDKIFEISVPNHNAMLKEFERIKTGVEDGNVCYQLYPNVNTTSKERYNCATLVAHLLKTGGLTSLPNTPEWKPSDFSNILEKQSCGVRPSDDRCKRLL